MITVEDIVEELFGEIDDEFDKISLTETKLSDYMFELSARLEVNYLNEKYSFNLPVSEDYGTLGGLIVNKTHDIPEVNKEITVDKFQFTIVDVSDTKINTVILKINK